MNSVEQLGNDRPAKMCVQCGQFTTNEFVCDDCEAPRNPNARPASTKEQHEILSKDERSYYMGWYVSAVLGVLLFASLGYIYVLKQAPNSAALQAKRPSIQINQNELVRQAPARPPFNPNNQRPPFVQRGTFNGNPNQNAGFARTQRQTPPEVQDTAGVAGAQMMANAFRQEYQRDVANQQRQDWDTYYGWVQEFYAGGWGHPGWKETGNDVLSRVQGNRHLAIRQKWNALGVLLGGEWSKDNGVRRIDTGDLSQLGQALQGALSRDRGDGATIEAKIDEVTQYVNNKRGGR